MVSPYLITKPAKLNGFLPVVCSLHLRTPTSLLVGKGFAGFLRPIWELERKSFLSMLGCV